MPTDSVQAGTVQWPLCLFFFESPPHAPSRDYHLLFAYGGEKKKLGSGEEQSAPVGHLLTEEARMGKECVQPHENAGDHLYPPTAPKLTSAKQGLAVPGPSSRLAPSHHVHCSHFSSASLKGHQQSLISLLHQFHFQNDGDSTPLNMI